MSRMFSLSITAIAFATVVALSLSSVSGSRADSQPETVLGTYVNLLVLNVVVQDENTGMPVTDLGREDFLVFDDGNPVHINYFGHASNPELEPLALWLVTECPKKSGEQNRSSSIATEADFLEPALEKLHEQDTVGVAHSCGEEGEAKIDLPLTADRRAPVEALKKILQQNPVGAFEGAGGQSVLKVLQLIHTSAPQGDPQKVPVVVFLGPSPATVSVNDAERIARDVMSHTSAQVFVIDERVPPRRASSHVPLIRYLSQETGGQAFTLTTTTGKGALERVVDGIHSRYLMAFFPPSMDGKWHTLKVQLSNSAVRKYGKVVVNYRSGYGGVGAPPHYSVSEASLGHEGTTDISFSRDAQTSEGKSEIPFEAEGATYEGQSQLAKFTLKLDGEPLSWKAIPDSSHRSEVTAVITFLSAHNEAIQRKVQRYEVVRSASVGWTPPNQPIVIFIFSEYPANVDHVRFLIRDDAAGRIGIQDLPMQKVLDAPKLRLIIGQAWGLVGSQRQQGGAPLGIGRNSQVGVTD